jgi:hypothetical protein
MCPHRNIHKYTWIFLDGKTDNQIDHTKVDRRWDSSILDARTIRGANYVTGHYLVVEKFRERLVVYKKGAQKYDGENIFPQESK